MFTNRFVAVALTAGLGVVAATSPGRTPDRSPVTRALDDLIKADGVPGAQAVITERGRSHEITRGVGDLRTGGPFPHQAQIRIGSNTKAFVATVMLQLVAEGRIVLDAPAEHYLPGVLHAVTIRQLLQHTSGLVDYLDLLDLYDNRWSATTPRQQVDAAMTLRPHFAPGTDWAYSNTNYALAGMVIEQVTGRSVGDEITRRLIVPLGLGATYFPRPSETGIRGRHPRGYQEVDGVLVDYTDQNTTMAGAAGAMVSTGADLNRFYIALLGGRVLPDTQLTEMKRTVPAAALPNAEYGLGLMRIMLSCGKEIWGHGGSLPGFRTRGGVTAEGVAVNVTVNEMVEVDHTMAAVEAAVCSR
ncbi:serine hydrolase domain-containing protein [Actinokineospora diospyrosa]|uniref:D-alanyl-D-alanine carboxypeptidase n=1 Tax=Actinokineospora diospyrosa TaxID=103728 RepID=A0ABT1IA09_9PSEU|nr:serine hydrolase domain-containing protein [Actinokineospora diospyrosa]MCP2269376.1 D-alanyl-D-alanine carboxypeptidase [Actinokineospora diospyrosa]